MTALLAPLVQVRWEIWKSLLALLRSYTALARMSDGVYVVVEPAGSNLLLDTVLLESRHATISLNFDPSTGNGTWAMSEVEGATRPRTLKKSRRHASGEYSMAQDGTLLLDNDIVELDMAAIDFVGKLVSFERGMEGGKGE